MASDPRRFRTGVFGAKFNAPPQPVEQIDRPQRKKPLSLIDFSIGIAGGPGGIPLDFGKKPEPTLRRSGAEVVEEINLRDTVQQISPLQRLVTAAETKVGEGSPELQEALTEAKEFLGQQITGIDDQIKRQLRQLQVLEGILDKQMAPNKDVVLDELLSVADAVELQSGLSDEFLQSILDNVDNPQLVKDMLETEELRQTALVEIENFVFQKEQLRDKVANQEEALRRQDIATNAPTFSLGFSDDPDTIAAFTATESFENLETERFSPDEEDTLQTEFFEIAQRGLADPTYDARVELGSIATRYGFEPEVLNDMYQDGLRLGLVMQEELSGALDKPQLQPGSMGLAFAIFQIAKEIYPEDIATMLANSPLLHEIIGLSDGDVNFAGGGDLRGVGSMSEQVYNELGTPYESVQDDMGGQLRVLLQYLMAGWNGDIRSAYISMLQNGGWGTLPLLLRNESFAGGQ